MAFKLVDRVRETTISPGTATATLSGAALGYQTFSAGVGANNTTYYVIADQSGANWEVGYGTVGATGTTLARTTVLSSSNAGSLVNFASGTQDVWVDYPATKAIYLDSSGNASALGTVASAVLTNATGLPISTGVSGLATGAATFLATPSSANLLALLTDETGTGANVFATSPTLVTPLLGTPTSGVLTNCTGYTYANLSGTVPTWNQNTTGTAANVTGIVALANGGSGTTTAQLAMNVFAGAITSGSYLRGNGTNVVMSTIQAADVPTLNQNTTGSAATLATGRTIAITGDLTYTSGSFNGSANVTGTGTLANTTVTAGSYTGANITIDSKGRITNASNQASPAITVLTSGSGTYNTPANTKYIVVEMVGGGGGGAAPAGSAINGATGGSTTFGTATCNGGGGGATNDNGGAGGASTFFASGAAGIGLTGGSGGPNAVPGTGAWGGNGGSSFFGGGGTGRGGSNYSSGGNGAANTGGGGGGAGGSNGGQPYGGGGGGSGAYISAIIVSPASTYSYSIGAGGGGGNNGAVVGGSGGSGLITVTAYF